MLASNKSDTSLWAMAQLDAKEKGVTTDDYLASVLKAVSYTHLTLPTKA